MAAAPDSPGSASSTSAPTARDDDKTGAIDLLAAAEDAMQPPTTANRRQCVTEVLFVLVTALVVCSGLISPSRLRPLTRMTSSSAVPAPVRPPAQGLTPDGPKAEDESQRPSRAHEPDEWCWVEDKGYCSAPPTSFLCTPHGWAWRPCAPQEGEASSGGFVEGEEACRLLEQSGVRRLLMAGDSFIRHAYEAVAMTLSGDYETGGVEGGGVEDADCHGEGQFEEKKCRMFVPPHKVLCGGGLHVGLAYGTWVPLKPDMSGFDVVVWGGGQHPVDGDYERKRGVNDASVVEEEIFHPVCQSGTIPWLPIDVNTTSTPRLFWLVPHTRLMDPPATESIFRAETRDRVRVYAEESVGAIQRQCGADVRPIDVHNFTQALVTRLPEEAAGMTFDTCHWGRAVNLVKAQMILRAISSRRR